MHEQDIIMGQKPYLIRAMYEWMMDFGYTPRLIVSPLVRGVVLPEHLAQEYQVTLDISPYAVGRLELGKYNVSFDAQFSGKPFHVVLSLNCIGAIIAKEREVGYIFDIENFLPSAQTKPQVLGTSLAENTENEVVQQNQLLSKGRKPLPKTSKKSRRRPKKKKLDGLFSGFKNLLGT